MPGEPGDMGPEGPDGLSGASGDPGDPGFLGQKGYRVSKEACMISLRSQIDICFRVPWASQASEERLVFQVCLVYLEDKVHLVFPDATELMAGQVS